MAGLRELLVFKEPDQESVAAASTLIEKIATALEQGSDATAELSQLQSLVGHEDFQMLDLESYWLHSSAEDVAKGLLGTRAVYVPDLTKSELVDIVERCTQSPSEAECNYYLALFQKNCPNPAKSDLIFWPPQEWLDRIGRDDQANSPTPTEVVEEALRWS